MASITQIIRRRKQRKHRQRVRQGRNQIWGGVVAVIFALIVIVPLVVIMGVAASAFARAAEALPTQSDSITIATGLRPTQIYDSSGRTLLVSVEDPLGDAREWLTLDDLPTYLIDATLIMEDPDFLTAAQPGIVGTVSRLWDNLLNGPVLSDSSLTGRLIQNIALPQRGFVSVDDRALEIALVGEVNRRYTPEEVLEWHLNTNYYGTQAYGIQAAAEIYFGKSARDLTLDEAALLASIPTAPQYNPIDNESAARRRQNDVLRLLLADSSITQSQFEQASNTMTPIQPSAGQSPQIAPEFATYARRQAEIILDSLDLNGGELVARGGLRITTTLDLDLYYQSECALRVHLARLSGTSTGELRTLNDDACISADFLPAVLGGGGNLPPDSGVVTIIDAQTGVIRAMVGTATRTIYQPGPVLHPFIYLDGFISAEYTPATMVLDIPLTFPGPQDGLIYPPQNPDDTFRGPLNLRDAMAMGLVPPAAQVANARNAGINGVIRRTANQLGINSLTESIYDLSLLERGGAVSVLDVAYAYSVFAAMGDMNGVIVPPLAPGLRQRDPVAVARIEDADGNLLWEYEPALSRAPGYLQSELAYLVNNILADSNQRRGLLGANNIFELDRRTAVVNGMTADGVDNWTVGYTPQMVVAVQLHREERGGMTFQPYAPEGAAVIWRALLEYAHIRDGLPAMNWTRPDGIVEETICELSGLLATQDCPRRTEIFLPGTQPRDVDDRWQVVNINTQTRTRATPNTDPTVVSAELYFIPPNEAMDWWQANGRSLPPQEFDTISRPDLLQSAVILQPEPYTYVSGAGVDVRGTIDTADMAYYQLVYSQWDQPGTFIDITGQRTEFTPGTSLGTWDTTGLNGLYTLQLQVTYNDNTRDTYPVQVTVDNTPPSIELTTDKTLYRWNSDTVIPVRAIVEDNLRIDRVVFYHNGQQYGIDDDCHLLPDECGFDWEITRTGTETFTAVIYDSVGNTAQAEITVEVVR